MHRSLRADHLRPGAFLLRGDQAVVGLGQLGENARELGLVALVDGHQYALEHRLRRRRPDRRRQRPVGGQQRRHRQMVGLDGREDGAGLDHPGCKGPLGARVLNRAEAGAAERRALFQPLRKRADKHRLADVLPVKAVETHRQQRALLQPAFRGETRAQAPRRRSFMTQRLHQAHHAVAVARRADHDRNDPVFPEHARGDRIDRVACRLPVLDEFLEQPVVELRQMFEHFRPRLMLALGKLRRQFHERRGLPLAVAPCPLRDQVAAPDDPCRPRGSGSV